MQQTMRPVKGSYQIHYNIAVIGVQHPLRGHGGAPRRPLRSRLRYVIVGSAPPPPGDPRSLPARPLRSLARMYCWSAPLHRGTGGASPSALRSRLRLCIVGSAPPPRGTRSLPPAAALTLALMYCWFSTPLHRDPRSLPARPLRSRLRLCIAGSAPLRPPRPARRVRNRPCVCNGPILIIPPAALY
jgi:hypothetical protein